MGKGFKGKNVHKVERILDKTHTKTTFAENHSSIMFMILVWIREKNFIESLSKRLYSC